MDKILFVGVQDEKLTQFCKKMGHQILEASESETFLQLVESHVVDLILIDSEQEADAVELCQFFRGLDRSKDTPILLLASHRIFALKLREAGLEDVEILEAPYSLGKIASLLATQLRLRKMKGADESTASLSQMNAALRDYTEKVARELEEAKRIQNSLLPSSLPAHDKVDMAASYEPLDEVGGDWYYAAKTDDGKISVQIADVTGHGLSAAFIGSMTKLAMIAANKH